MNRCDALLWQIVVLKDEVLPSAPKVDVFTIVCVCLFLPVSRVSQKVVNKL